MRYLDGWAITVGLEVHIQLLTKSKLFSGASTAYGGIPNTQVSYIDLAMPGTLPVLNEKAVEMAVLFGLSIGASIAPEAIFARKHYFYPDLPKGYQISQHHHPIVGAGGSLMISTENGKTKRIQITRAHLEEDAGKSLHGACQTEDATRLTGIDLNRAGVPLLEIVTEPELCSAQEAVSFLKTLHQLVRYLKICDGNMQEGSFRCDANVSVRPEGETVLGIRSELKNLNSFKYVEDAILVEAARQIEAITAGEILRPETRTFDPARQKTLRLREKEAEADYRYIPDPDLCPVRLSPELISRITGTMPELPDAKKTRFQKQYQLTDYDIGLLITSREQAAYFEAVVAKEIDPKLAANWINGELAAALNESKLEIEESPIAPEKFADLLRRVANETISRGTAKTIFEHLWNGLKDIDSLIEQEGLGQLNDDEAIRRIIQSVLKDHPEQLKAYRQGREKLFGFFVGKVMQRSNNRCHPVKLNQLLIQQIKTSTLSSENESG
jgi:aspartyl-tRNA(Asn)/glutamyl-tRNA(Gln) amidotransferase subunit B